MSQIQMILISSICIVKQVRTEFDEAALQGLADSLKNVGQQQPIRVLFREGRYFLIDGERRYRAAQLAGLEKLAAIVDTDDLNAAAIIERQLAANCQRADLGVLEKAHAIADLMELSGMKPGETAKRLGFSPATVSRLLALLKLPESIQAEVSRGTIPESAAYELSRVDDPGEQSRLAAELVQGRLTRDGLAGRRKSHRHTVTCAERKSAGRVTAHLGQGRSVVVCGPLSGLEGLIELLEELLAKCRKARPSGVQLETFLKVLRDQSCQPLTS